MCCTGLQRPPRHVVHTESRVHELRFGTTCNLHRRQLLGAGRQKRMPRGAELTEKNRDHEHLQSSHVKPHRSTVIMADPGRRREEFLGLLHKHHGFASELSTLGGLRSELALCLDAGSESSQITKICADGLQLPGRSAFAEDPP